MISDNDIHESIFCWLTLAHEIPSNEGEIHEFSRMHAVSFCLVISHRAQQVRLARPAEWPVKRRDTPSVGQESARTRKLDRGQAAWSES